MNKSKLTKTRKSYTLKQKVDIIREIQTGALKDKVAKNHGVPNSTISTIWKSRAEILERFKRSNPKLKKTRGVLYENVDKILFDWFKEHRTNGIPLDGTILKAKAQYFADALGIAEFVASNGWFDGWKRRYDVSFQRLRGEANSAPVQSKQDWLENKWPVIRAGYAPEEIYNADETGLFFKMLPEKTYNGKFNNSHGKKQCKQRVTVLLCSNMTGEDKLRPLVIGKSAKPRKFPRNHNSLPVTYRANKSAWMTGHLWEEFLLNWDQELLKKKRNILLLIDNCTAHVTVPFLKNIQIEYLPPNVTSILQPMDQGVIKNFKLHYRRRIIQKLLCHLELKKELLNIVMIDAIFDIHSAWNSVSSTTIRNCFRHGGLTSESDDVELIEPDLLTQLQSVYNDVLLAVGEVAELVDDYIAIDDGLEICETRTEEALCAEIIKSRMETGQEVTAEGQGIEDDEGQESEADEESDLTVVSTVQTNPMDHVDGLRLWILKNCPSSAVYLHLSAIENAILDHQVHNQFQRKITDYFSPTDKDNA